MIGDLETRLLQRLSPDNLLSEVEFLKRCPNFELPYGRAWFLLLLLELEKRGLEVEMVRQYVTDSVTSWLELSRFSICGSHQSWLFSFWLALVGSPLTTPLHVDTRTRLHCIYDRKITPEIRDSIVSSSKRSGGSVSDFDFIDLPQILILIESYREVYSNSKCSHAAADIPVTNQPPESNQASSATADAATDRCLAVDGILQCPPIVLRNCHVPGRLVMGLWSPKLPLHEYEKGLELVISRRDLWKTDFMLVSHWVPQFIWMSVWIRLGMP